MANFGERWAAARTRLPKAAPGFASVIRNSQVQKWRGARCAAACFPSRHAADEATPDGTIPYCFNFLTQRGHALAGFIRHDAEQEVDRVVEAAGTEIVYGVGLLAACPGEIAHS